MANETYLYPWSRDDAKDRNELELWQESHDANIACRKAIEAAIMQDHDGSTLAPSCTASVIAEYGYKRVRFVLANSVQHLENDGRFSSENRAWAKQTYVPDNHIADVSVASHPAVLNVFIPRHRTRSSRRCTPSRSRSRRKTLKARPTLPLLPRKAR